MHPNQEGQSVHLVMKLYEKKMKLLQEMLGLQYVISHEWLASRYQQFITF